jgi:hypothetical protein
VIFYSRLEITQKIMPKLFGLPIELPPFRGMVNPQFNDPAFLDILRTSPTLLRNPAAEILQKGRNLVGAVRLPASEKGALEVVIKEFSPRGIDKLKGLFLPSKGRRAWEGAGALFERGIGTPLPLLYLEEHGKNRHRSYFISQRLKDVEEIRGFFISGEKLFLLSLLQHLADALRFWHSLGILHRDLSDGNILVGSPDRNPEFFLIDTNRIRILKAIGPFRGIKNLIRLGVPESLQMNFLEFYLARKPVPRRFRQWYRLAKGMFTLYLRLKKILRIKKIARKLGIQ